MRVLCVALLCGVLAGCATKYQEMGFSGGVSAEQITSDTYRIVGRGNGYTGSNTIKDYVLLKAAETTQSVGATHFVITNAENAARAETVITPGTSTTSIVGNRAVTTTTPGYAENIIKPGQDVYIKVLKLAPGQSVPGAYAADEIIRFVSPRVKRD